MADLELTEAALNQATSRLDAALRAGSSQCLVLPDFGSPQVSAAASTVDVTLGAAADALSRVVADARAGLEAVDSSFAGIDARLGQEVR
ncbi:hypothetical protein [Isoptericola croceus]|uniref:hypothetical protein n=1 Tax=Isoptericola croceus TaxID=3031406 RepID=UPI0023F7532F|nr:hypothetical protein [Isoptericola croceus]